MKLGTRVERIDRADGGWALETSDCELHAPQEIAYDLAEGGASAVWLAARTPPNILLRTGPGSGSHRGSVMPSRASAAGRISAI